MKSKRNIFVIALVLVMAVLLPVIFTPVLAYSGMRAPMLQEPQVMDLTAFLQWLIGGGGSIIAVSWLFERMKWFQALSPDGKDYTIFGAAVVVGCTALAVVTYVSPVILAAIAPYFLIIASTFVMVFIAKAFHRFDRKSTVAVELTATLDSTDE